MIGLAIHTSSPELGLARVNLATGELRSQVWPLGRDLTAYLHPHLDAFIQPHGWQSLAFIAVAQGPGGFTGTRIGVVVARTLAQQLGIPLFGVSSLAAIAQSPLPIAAVQAPHIAVSMLAQRGEIFGAIYPHPTQGGTAILKDALYSQADWQAKLNAWTTPYYPLQAEGGMAHSVTGVLSLAMVQWQAGDRPSWHTVLPFYGQHPVDQLPTPAP